MMAYLPATVGVHVVLVASVILQKCPVLPTAEPTGQFALNVASSAFPAAVTLAIIISVRVVFVPEALNVIGEPV
jgi:uncharacterized membrane protein